MTKDTVTYTMRDRDDGLVEVTFGECWITSALEEDFDAHIDEVNEWVMNEFNIELEQIDWRDPNELWIWE